MTGTKHFAAVTVAAVVLLSAPTGHALPFLQLDIQGGTYVGGTDQTTYANSSSFQLYALLNSLDTKTEYAISAAIVPKTSVSPLSQFGSFKINGTTYSTAAGNMTFGTPPLDTEFDDIPGHSIFATHFAEVRFKFNGANHLQNYNVEYQEYIDPSIRIDRNPYDGLYQMFNIDASGLAAGYALHFDLYDPDKKRSTFAPFSHDAASRPNGGGDVPVPEGGATLVLLGTGLCALAATRRTLKKSSF